MRDWRNAGKYLLTGIKDHVADYSCMTSWNPSSAVNGTCPPAMDRDIHPEQPSVSLRRTLEQ